MSARTSLSPSPATERNRLVGVALVDWQSGMTLGAAGNTEGGRARMAGSTSLFLYLVIDRRKGNLGLARHHLARIEGELAI